MRKEKEKKKQNFNTSLEAERALTVIKATILNVEEKIVVKDNMKISK